MGNTKKTAVTKKSGASGGAGGVGRVDESLAAEAATAPVLPFEGALGQLERTVARLEEGEMPLEEALELFETGVKLSRQCTATLEAAEKRIEILVADRAQGDGFASAPFETDAFEDDEGFGED